MYLQHSRVLRKIPVTSLSKGQVPREKHPLAAKTRTSGARVKSRMSLFW